MGINSHKGKFMKVDQMPPAFQPVIIKLETNNELVMLRGILHSFIGTNSTMANADSFARSMLTKLKHLGQNE